MSRRPNEALQQAVIEAVRNFPEATYKEIGRMLGCSHTRVSKYALKSGIVRHKTTRTPVVQQPITLHNVDSEIESLERKLKELKEKRESLLIHFEHDDEGRVWIVGVSGIGALCANWRDWLRFLTNNGAANLREYINKHCLNGNGVH